MSLEYYNAMMREFMTCPICGLPKKHDRLRGYVCHSELHNEQIRNMEAKELERLRNDPKQINRHWVNRVDHDDPTE